MPKGKLAGTQFAVARPVLTRWNTWLETCFYFYKNFYVIQHFLERISENDPNVEFLSNLIDQMNSTRLQTQLAGISANFTALTEAITSIQGPIGLVQPLEIISNIEAVTITEPYRKKLKQVLNKPTSPSRRHI